MLDEYCVRSWVAADVKDITDGVVPPSRFPEFVELVRIYTASCVEVTSYAILSEPAENDCKLLFKNIKAWSAKCWREGNYKGDIPVEALMVVIVGRWWVQQKQIVAAAERLPYQFKNSTRAKRHKERQNEECSMKRKIKHKTNAD